MKFLFIGISLFILSDVKAEVYPCYPLNSSKSLGTAPALAGSSNEDIGKACAKKYPLCAHGACSKQPTSSLKKKTRFF